jgi:hypothetical protein
MGSVLPVPMESSYAAACGFPRPAGERLIEFDPLLKGDSSRLAPLFEWADREHFSGTWIPQFNRS